MTPALLRAIRAAETEYARMVTDDRVYSRRDVDRAWVKLRQLHRQAAKTRSTDPPRWRVS